MKQAEKIYMISDAAKKVKVEAHVLRYWEEELELPAKRNEMGHRYYTEEDIRQFVRIKELKEQGLQLKAIRNLLKNDTLSNPISVFGKNMVMVKKGEILPLQEKAQASAQEESREQKSIRLQQLLRDMIAEAVQSNNQEICQEIKDSLLKELDYQFRIQEEREDARDAQLQAGQEEHYRQIDELLRERTAGGKRKKVHVSFSEKIPSSKNEISEGKKDLSEKRRPSEKKLFFQRKIKPVKADKEDGQKNSAQSLD